MRLAHISDLHLLDLTGISFRRFLNRRLIGGINLLLRRAREYRPAILETLVDDLLKEEIDHVAVSGDLSNLALEPEFERVFHLLRLIGGYDRVSVVPGNHDYYTFRAADTRKFEKYFSPFMFEREFSDLDVDVYPYAKKLGNVLLLGMNTATSTIPPGSYGTVGSRQLDLADRVLSRRENANLLVVLLLHHPLHKRDRITETTSGLLGRDKLFELIDKHRIGLVLHGHDHHGRIWQREQPGHVTRIVCCGSSTRLVDDPALMARYRIITIDDGRVRRIETKVYDRESRMFLLD